MLGKEIKKERYSTKKLKAITYYKDSNITPESVARFAFLFQK